MGTLYILAPHIRWARAWAAEKQGASPEQIEYVTDISQVMGYEGVVYVVNLSGLNADKLDLLFKLEELEANGRIEIRYVLY